MEDIENTEERTPAAPTPNLIEETLFKKRYVLVTGAIDDKVARLTSERLLALAASGDDPIDVYINSPGGHVESGDMIHDIIKFISPTVRTIGSGWVASAGALIFVAAERQNRLCLPNTRFMLHQPSGGMGGKVSDISIQVNQLKIMRDRFNRIFSEATGQPIEKIANDTERDYWMTPKEAIEYGLLGKVISSQSDVSEI